MLDQYSQLTIQACERFDDLDLVVWPETMFPIDDIVYSQATASEFPTGVTVDQLNFSAENFQRMLRNGLQRMNNRPADADPPGTHALAVGCRHMAFWRGSTATFQYRHDGRSRWSGLGPLPQNASCHLWRVCPVW